MKKHMPLDERIYFDPMYTEIVRIVGWDGFQVREIDDKLSQLYARFDKGKVQQAFYHLVTYEGQNRCNVKPLERVMLRSEVRPFCRGLLGFPPEERYLLDSPPAGSYPLSQKRPPPPQEETIDALPEATIRAKIEEAKKRLAAISVRSKLGKELKRALTALGKELHRRGLPLAASDPLAAKAEEPSKAEQPRTEENLATMSEEEIRAKFQEALHQLGTVGVHSALGKELGKLTNALSGELHRRGLDSFTGQQEVLLQSERSKRTGKKKSA